MMTDLRSEASAGTVVWVQDLPGEQIILQVHNGHLTVQPAGQWEAPTARIERTAITRVERPPDKGDMRQVSEFYRSRRGSPAEQAEQAEKGAVMTAATKNAALKARATSKASTRKAPAKKAAAPKPALKAVPDAKAPEPTAERVQPTAAMKAKGAVRITGRSEAKQKVNFAIVEAVLVKDTDVEAVAKKHGIGTAQVKRIVGLAKGEIDPDRKL